MLAAVVAAVVVQQNAPSTSRSVAAPAAVGGVSVPPTDPASTAWYCAAGTSTRDGRADETVIVASLSQTRLDVDRHGDARR